MKTFIACFLEFQKRVSATGAHVKKHPWRSILFVFIFGPLTCKKSPVADYTPTSDKVEAEVNAVIRLWKQYPKLRLFALLIAATVMILWPLHYMRGKAALSHIVEEQRKEIDALRAENTQLKVEIAPFVTATVLKYSSGTAQNSKKLADDISEMQSALDRETNMVRSLSVAVTLVFSGPWKH